MIKPMRRVYRIEHSERGHGPWQSPDDRGELRHVAPWFQYPQNDSPTCMPTPSDDKLLRGCSAWMLQNRRFAYPSIATLLSWWTPRYRRLAHDNGYVVRVYAVDWDGHTLYRNQVAFNADFAIPLRTISLLGLEANGNAQLAAA